MNSDAQHNPPYLPVGTEVSAKYKGAFCEAKIRKIVRVVKCKVTFKAGLGSATLLDDQIKGTLRIGNTVEAKHHDKNQFVEGTINKIQDCSQYTVVFDDGDITTLRRSALVLKSGRHFNESETLDQLPLTHPEHFSNPVVGGRRGVRRRANNEDNDRDDSSEDEDIPVKKGRKKPLKEADMGKVVCVDSTDKKKSKDNWFPALVVSPSAQETVKIRTKDEYLVRSFRDGRYYTVPKKETTGFTKDSAHKSELISNVLRTACEKAVQYLEKNELPPHWDRDVLFGHLNASNSDDALSDSDSSEDDPREEKDRFVAQLYKFMDERGTPINKVPTVCNKDLDLYKLYKIVTSKGGYNKVSNSSQWKPVTMKMGYGIMPTTSTINLVKQAYKKFLQNFEELYRKLGTSSLTSVIDSRPSSAAGTSRSHRSIFRERHASSSIKETKKVEEIKIEKDEEEKRTSPTVDTVETDSVLSDSGSKVSEQSEESSRRSRSRLDSSRSKKDSDESSEKQDKPIPITKSKRVYKKKDTAVTTPTPVSAAAAPTTATATITTTAAATAPVTSDNEKQLGNENSAPLVIPVVAPLPPPPVPVVVSSSSSSTTSVSSLSPGPTVAAGGKRGGRGKYKKKEKETPVEETTNKSEAEESLAPTSAHIGKNVKIQIGDKLQVYYGPQSEGNVTYEAKVVDIDEPNQKYLVHYTGWNTRYDEWIKRFRISSLSVGSRQEQGKSNEGGIRQQEQGGGKGLSDSNSDLESVQQSQSSSKPPTTPKITSTTTTRRKGRPLSGSQAAVATAGNSSSNITSSSKVGGRRRQPSESEKVRAQRRPRRKSGQNQSGSGIDSSEDDSEEEEEEENPPSLPIKTSISSPSSSSLRTTKGRSSKRLIEDEEAFSAPTAGGTNKQVEASQALPSSSSNSLTTSTTATTVTNHAQNQVLDLNQIRSELKGLDKMVKLTQQQQQQSSSSVCTPLNSSGTSTTTTMTAGSSATQITVMPQHQQSADDKLDIYEFQDDDTPKLKMFSPRSPEKKDEASVNKISLCVGGDNSSKSVTQQSIQEDSTTAMSKEVILGTLSSSVPASSLMTPTNLPAAKNFSSTQMTTKVEFAKGKKDVDMLTTIPSTTKGKSYSSSGHVASKTTVSATPPSHSFQGAVATASHSTGMGTKILNATITGASPMLQTHTTTMESKSTLRMLTPILHASQPLRQRAVLSHSFPPPLIPSLNTTPPKPVLPIPIQPRSGVSSPPMPSLIQKPISSTSVMGTSLPLSTNQQQHLRPIAPTSLSAVVGGISSSPVLSHTTTIQSTTSTAAVVVRALEPKSSFVSRQELFPNLIQQAKNSGKSGTLSIPKLTTTNVPHSSSPVSAVNISLSPIPISSISPSQTMFHSSPASSAFTKGETTTKGSQGISAKSTLGDTVTTVGSSNHPLISPLTRKPNLKRKKPVKEKIQNLIELSTTSIILPEIITATTGLKSKKRPKKVITKNIIDLQKDDSTLKDKPEEQVKKPRKPSRKKLKLEQVYDDPVIIPVKPERPIKTKEKQPRRKNTGKSSDSITGVVTAPMQTLTKSKAPITAMSTQVQSPAMTVGSNVGSTTHYVFSPTLTTTSPPTSTSINERIATGITSSSIDTTSLEQQGVANTPDLHSGLESKQFKGTPLGVLKSVEKKSYASKMSAATTARVISCIDNVAKLPVESSLASLKIDPLSSSQKLPVIISSTVSNINTPGAGVGSSKSILNVLPIGAGKIQPVFSTTTTTATSLSITKVSKVLGESPRLTTSVDTQLPLSVTKSPTGYSTSTTALVISSGGNDYVSSSGGQKSSKAVTLVSMSQDVKTHSVSPPSQLAVTVTPTIKNPDIKEEKNLFSSFSSIPTVGDDSSLRVGCATTREKDFVQRSKTNSPILKNEDKMKPKDTVSLSVGANVTDKDVSTTKEEDESCHSLLCEEIIPGSPGSGLEDDDSPFDDENARIHSPVLGQTTGVKKEQISSKTPFDSSNAAQCHSKNQIYQSGRNSGGDTTLSQSSKEKSGMDSTSLRAADASTRSVKKEEKDHKDFEMKTEDDLGASSESNLSILQKHREVGKAAQSLLSLSGIERPTTSSGNGGFNHSRSTIQHVIDNTPPTTPESSSISSGSPRVDGGRVSPTNDHASSSKSKDSSDGDSADNQKNNEAAEEGFSSDAGRKSTKGRCTTSPSKKNVDGSRNARTSSPPLKRRRIQRKKSPDEVIRSYTYRGRGSGTRKGNSSNDIEHHGRTIPPQLNITKPPLSNKYNFIPDLDDDVESEQRIQAYQQALHDIKEKYIEIKAELASFERRRRRTNKKRKKDAVLMNKIS